MKREIEIEREKNVEDVSKRQKLCRSTFVPWRFKIILHLAHSEI